MNNLLPYTTTATELQRNFKTVAQKAKNLGEPLIVLTNNQPTVVLMDYNLFRDSNIQKKNKKYKKKSDGFDEFFGVWTKEEADGFDKFIEAAFEKVDPEDWK